MHNVKYLHCKIKYWFSKIAGTLKYNLVDVDHIWRWLLAPTSQYTQPSIVYSGGSSTTYYAQQKDKREIKSPLSSFQKVNKSGLLAKMIFVGAGNPMPLCFLVYVVHFSRRNHIIFRIWCLLLVTRERGKEEAICWYSFKKQPVLFPDVLHGRRIWCHSKGLMTMYQKHSANIALWYLHWSEEDVLTRLRCWQKSFFPDRKNKSVNRSLSHTANPRMLGNGW